MWQKLILIRELVSCITTKFWNNMCYNNIIIYYHILYAKDVLDVD